MSNAAQVIEDLNRTAQKSDAEYVGTMCTLSVQTGEIRIKHSDIERMILSNPAIPDDWAPENRNKLTMYLDCVNKLKNTQSLTKFRPYQEHFPFNPDEEHAAYMGMRVYYSRDSNFPVAHNILHVRQSEDVDEFNQRRLETDEAITIQLERTEGNSETDHTTSQFAINFPDDTPQEYFPFLLALQDMFKERINRVYDSGAIRSLINDILKEKMGAESVRSSLYFIHDENIAALDALRDGFRQLNSGIDLLLFHVHNHTDVSADHPINATFSSVSRGVTRSIVEEVKELNQEIKERLEDTETDTRPSTWRKRADELKELQGRVQKFKNKRMLVEDVADSLIEETRNMIVENL